MKIYDARTFSSAVLTKREWFCGMALQGLLAHGHIPTHCQINDPDFNFDSDIALQAISIANAILIKLEDIHGE